MGTTTLTLRDWIFFSGSMIATSTIAAFIYRFLSTLFTKQTPHPTTTITVLTFSGLLALLLIFFRFRKSRTFWLKLWILGSPWFVSSLYILPTVPLLLIPLFWLSLIVLALWGYYGRFAL